MRWRRGKRGAAARPCASAAARPWPSSSRGSMTEIRKLGVVGAGQMGAGIAQVAAQAGIEVVLADASAQLAERGKKRIDQQLEQLVQKGKLDAAVRAATLEKIHA